MIEEISSVMNEKISNYSDLKLNAKFLSLFIEQAQNILHYSADRITGESGTQLSHGFILTGVKDGTIFIISGNPIDPSHEKILKSKLESINKYPKSELKKLFKEQLKSENDNFLSKGASLGLIELCRKSDNMEYHFDKTPSGELFFSIKTEYYYSETTIE